MVEFYQSLKDIENDFIKNNIPFNMPGFYDHQNFLKIEQANPQYLNNYARYVQLKSYNDKYIERARKEIPIIVQELYKELLHDGRQGACVDMSGVLSRILEREGFWNFALKGSLTITFPKGSDIEKRYFWSVDQGNFVAGHAWVFAPPFFVIDITLKQQQYIENESKYLPKYVLSEESKVIAPEVEDIISPEMRAYLKSNGVSKNKQLETVNPVMVKFLETFNTYHIKEEDTLLKYIPVAVGASDCPLEEMVGISLEGKSAFQIYKETVLPELLKNRPNK